MKDWKKGTYYFRTDAAAEFLGVTGRTFRIHRKLLGIEGRKIPRRRGRFYSYEDIVQIADLIAPRVHLWAFRLDKRLRLLEEAKGREQGESP